FDAVINYISSLGFGSDDLTEFEQYWDNAEVCHIIGKDITRFHCVMWPAMLKSAGVKIPDSVFGHGFIYHRGEKMSKSLGNVVSPLDIVDRFGPDPLRFFLLREVVYGNDGDFTYDRFIDRYNSDLANDLGNLVSRTISMIHKYLGGKFTIPDSESSVLKKRSKVLIKQSKIDLKKDFPKLKDEWENCINEFQLSNACNETWDYIRKANRYIEQQAPWKLAKDPDKKDELIGILYDLASAICGISILLYPYMPSSCEKIWKAFGNKGSLSEFSFDMLGERCDISAPIGVEIENIGALFPRIEEEKTVAEETKKPDALEEKSDDEGIITFEDFLKLDIRIGTVKQAEKIEGSKKLLRLRIDDGMGGRQVIAGIAEHFEPEDLVGKQVAFVANLKPRKMMGEYSQGMVLAAEDSGKFSILMPSAGVSPGAKVS
ncbi:MAG: methionine--tRNA ligase subunit beta, partial [Candidatus Latescibacteria bacterium]|nr:methionine--tRNA ligase subunit beta [Candidatus Latescibacterota bacterium]